MNGICFLEPHAALATCNLEGRIAVWRMGPAPDPRKDFSDFEQGSNAEIQDQGLSPLVQQDLIFFIRDHARIARTSPARHRHQVSVSVPPSRSRSGGNCCCRS